MDYSYDIPSEPRLSNLLHINRPVPQARTKMKQKKRTSPTPDVESIFLGLDDTVPLDESISTNGDPNLYSSPPIDSGGPSQSTLYINQNSSVIHGNNSKENDNFYVMPRQESTSSIPTTLDNSYHMLNSSSSLDDNNEVPSTPPPCDGAQFYATPPTFARNFVLESNVSFDDSAPGTFVSLDTVPDIVIDENPSVTKLTNYYSYPEQAPPSSIFNERTSSQRGRLVNGNGEKTLLFSQIDRALKRQLVAQQQQQQQYYRPLPPTPKDEKHNFYSLEPVEKKETTISPLIDDFLDISTSNDDDSKQSDKTTDYLEIVRENKSNCRCADCDSENPTIAIMSWLLVVCKKCAAVHRLVTSDFLRLQSLITTACDPDLIDLLHEFGNRLSNSLLENNSLGIFKPKDHSSRSEREQYIQKKYLDKTYLRPYGNATSTTAYSQGELDSMLYENVETSDYERTLHLLMLGANPNYSEKMFAVADHANRHQQIKQMKLIMANGGQSEFDLMKTNVDNVNQPPHETCVHLATKHGVLKEFLTRYEGDRLKICSISGTNTSVDKQQQRCFSEIDLNNVLAICNQSVTSIPLKCRLSNAAIVTVNSQCTLIVDDQASFNEYLWVFPNEVERALWTRELLKRQYAYHQLIYSDFILLTKLNVQEGINAEKQQATALVYPGRFVICSDTIFDEVDLRKYCSLTCQKSDEFSGVVLCLVSNRFLYLSSPIPKLTEILFSCLTEGTRVKTLTDLRCQILTSQNVPVIVERFINFIFEHGLESKGIYRQAGQETKIKQLLQECLEDPFNSSLNRDNYTEHDVANALKRFFRQLETPLLGTRRNYEAWLRSTVGPTMTNEQLIQYYRALLVDLKQRFPVNYATLRKMLLHLQTVAMLADRNSMTLSNLVSIFAPCLLAQPSPVLINSQERRRGMSLDDLDMRFNTSGNEQNESGFTNRLAFDDETTTDSLGLLDRNSPTTRLKRNQSFQSPRHSIISTSPPSRFPFSSSYAHVTPSIQADLEIMHNLCEFYRQLFDVTDDEIEREITCVRTLLSVRGNLCPPRKLEGTMVSVYFESRADELNGYAINVLEHETTADTVIDKLLRQINKHDCFFWALFEVILDQNLERPMYSCEDMFKVLHRYRTYLPQELNRQATFVVKLNYIQFEKERLQQNQQQNDSVIECEYFDANTKRWISCLWTFEKAVIHIHRISNNASEKAVRWKPRFTSSTTPGGSVRKDSMNNSITSEQPTIYSWSVEEIYLYIGADRRIVTPFDMNEYRTLTILPRGHAYQATSNEIPFGIAFRFADRHQMFAWYLNLAHINGHDQWTRQAPRTIPDGVNYLPLQNYHTPSSSSFWTPTRKKSEQIRTKLMAKSSHVASTLGKQIRK